MFPPCARTFDEVVEEFLQHGFVNLGMCDGVEDFSLGIIAEDDGP